MSFIAVAVGGGALAAGAGLGTAAAIGLGASAVKGISDSAKAGKAQAKAAGQMADASAEIADRQQTLAEEQYRDQKALLDEFRPMLKEQLAKSNQAQDLSTQRSNEAWADYTTTWRPVEQRLAQASLDWASPGRAEQEAARAAGDATTQFDRAQQESTRALTMAGASQEKIAALEAAGRLTAAKGVAGAASTARRDTEKAGLAYLDNAARFGRNMTSTGIATAQLAGQQGAQTQAGYGALQAATAAPASATSGLLSAANSAYGTAGNLQLGAGQLAMQSQQMTNGLFGDMLGAGLKAYGMGMFGSSKKLKDVDGVYEPEDASEAVEHSPSMRWSYKPGLGDGNTKRRIGPTAESLAAVAPEVSDGDEVDGIAMLGLHHAAIGGHGKRLKRIEKKLGLADARRA